MLRNLIFFVVVAGLLVASEGRPQFRAKRIPQTRNRCFFTGVDGDGRPYLAMCKHDIKPSSRAIQDDVQFYLYTRSTRNNAQQVIPGDDSTLGAFSASKSTKYVIHGFTESVVSSGWMTTLKDALLDREDANIVLVNWMNLAAAPWYNIAAESCRPVGEYLATLIDYFVSKGASLGNQHIIGFSLGGQVSGFAGAAVSAGQVARISGLDPAHPLFENTGTDGHLDPSDGAFVDVTHTNSGDLIHGQLSFLAAVGHVDFYPNGGQRQPGCHDLFDSIESIFEACSHGRNPQLYINSVTDSSAFSGYSCSSYDAYTLGNCVSCSGSCPQIGYNARPGQSGVYYLATRDRSPFTGKQIFVTFTFSSSQQSTAGHIYLTLSSSGGSDTAEAVNENSPLSSGAVLHSAIAVLSNLSNFNGGSIKFDQDRPQSDSISLSNVEVFDPATNQRICSGAVNVNVGATNSVSWSNC